MGVHFPGAVSHVIPRVAIGVSLAIALLAPAPVDASSVGVHSLNDSSTSPGAQATYRYVSAHDAWKLTRIVVHPPNVRAAAGKTAQKVGWSFTIQRRLCAIGGCSAWDNDYTSPTFKAVTSDTTNAAFSNESVGVRTGGFTYDGGYGYRAIVNMFWYRPNGSVQGTAKAHVVYYLVVTGTTSQVVTNGIPAFD